MPEELMASELCEVYGVTPLQLREEFSHYERQVFWHIQQCKLAKRNEEASRRA